MPSYPAQGRAQTFILSSGGRLNDVGLYFSAVDATGEVRVMVCNTDGNNPDQTSVIAETTITASALKTSGRVAVAMPPEYLPPGRYSLNILSTGAHRLRLSDQPRSVTQGEHYAYTGDNQYIRPSGEADRPIAFDITFQSYDSTKYEIDLTPISMAGGMDGVEIRGLVQEPDGTDAYFQIQIGGVWQTLGITGGQRVAFDFSTRPSLVPLRLVFEGTLDKMPAAFVGAPLTEVVAFQLSETLKHVSEVMDVGAGESTSSIKISASLWGYDETDMDATLSLIVGGASVAATSVKDTVFPNGDVSRTATFALGAPTQTYQAVIEGAVTAGLTHRPIVERVRHFAGV